MTIKQELKRLKNRTGKYASRVNCRANHMQDGVIQRYRRVGTCVECSRMLANKPNQKAKRLVNAKAWAKNNHERYLKYQREYRAKNPAAYREYQREYHKTHYKVKKNEQTN